jgi:hypothetical protein
MPGGDRTGPLGLGPGTGWGRGLCSGFDVRGFFFGGRGRGFRRGFGGFGSGPLWGAPTVSQVDEASFLKSRISAMEDALTAARKQLSEIEAEKK